MNEARRRQFLGKPRIAVLSFLASDGSPVSTPIWYEYRDGKFYLRTLRETFKARCIGRDPRVSICIQDEEPPYSFVAVRGKAKLVQDPDPMELGKRLAHRYLGRIGGNYFLREIDPQDEGTRVTLEIEPERAQEYDGQRVAQVALPLRVLGWLMRRIPGL